ncbi:eukaryotic translation initiation factor 5 [Limosa lapponica baueri]|uniref:Eukaryotic translation initiation factor 5 n=1 Tax=Limosa lapponica baueri TaxID=1758121 RepID=A0A2I0TQS9_LIMLA|nr:eukaryotic translation initiation factor 5 [Limosa lapponica baueri]
MKLTEPPQKLKLLQSSTVNGKRERLELRQGAYLSPLMRGVVLSSHSPKFPKVTKATVMPTGSEVVPVGYQKSGETGTGKKEKDKKNRKGKDKENGSVSSNETLPPPPPEEITPPQVVEEEDDDDWGEDTTEEAQRRRMDEISDHAKNLTLSEDLERTVEERVNILFDFVKKKKEEGVIDTSDKDIVAEAERLDVKAMGPLVLTEVLFDEKIREQIRKYRRHFLRFCHNNKKAQRYLLHGFECVVAMHQSQLISKIPHILKEMYDADLLEEEVILSWAEKASKKYVSKELAKEIRVKAEPFIKWLKEAEEESSGNEEEDEDENLEEPTFSPGSKKPDAVQGLTCRERRNAGGRKGKKTEKGKLKRKLKKIKGKRKKRKKKKKKKKI